MNEAALQRFFHQVVPADNQIGDTARLKRSCDCRVVAQLRQQADRRIHAGDELGHLKIGFALHPEHEQLDTGSLLVPHVPGLSPQLDSLVEDRAGALEVAGGLERLTEVGKNGHAGRVGAFEHTGGTIEQVSRRRDVVPVQRPSPRRGETPGRAPPELPSSPVDGPQLRPQAVRLLEVIAQDLLVLLSAVGRHPLQPRCEALVKERPLVLGQALIRGVTYEQVAEAEGVLARHVTLVRAYQLLAHESEQMRRHVRPRVLGCQLGNRSSMEHLALDRSPLHELPLPGL